MATTLGSIVVELLAKTGSFDTDIKRSAKEAEKRMKEMSSRMEDTATSMGKKVGGILAGTFSVAAIKRTIDGLDALNDVADATGASIENISALEDAGMRAGNSFESVTTALIKFNSELKDTDPESKTADIIKRLGLNIEALREMDPAEALHKVARALAEWADDGNKARVIQELFGKSVKEVAPLLKDLAEQGELNAKVTSEQAKQAEDFNKQLAVMSKNSIDAARALVLEMIPAISSLSQEFTIGMQKSKGFWDALLTFGTINPFKTQASNINSLREEIDDLEAARARYVKSNSDTSGIDDALKQARRQLDFLKALQAQQALAATAGIDTSDALSRAMAGRSRPSIGAIPKKGPKGPDPDADFKAYLNQLEQQIQKVKELTAVETLNDDIRRGRLTVSKAQKDQLDVLAKLVDKHKEWNEQMKFGRERAIEEGDAVTKANEAYQDRLKSLIDATPMAQTEKLRSDLQLLMDEFNREGTELSKNPKLFQQAWDAALERVTPPLAQFNLQLTETQNLAMNMGEAGLRSLEDMAIEGDNLNDVFSNLLKTFAHMVFQIGVLEPAMRMLREAMTGVGGGVPPNPFAVGTGGGIDWGSLFTKGFSSVLGGGIGGGIGGIGGGFTFGGGLASGGPTFPNMEYDVGELGRERFRPRTFGTIFPAGSSDMMQKDFKINNYGPPITSARLDPRDRALILNEARQMTAADAGDPSSALSQSFQRSTNLRPRRF